MDGAGDSLAMSNAGKSLRDFFQRKLIRRSSSTAIPLANDEFLMVVMPNSKFCPHGPSNRLSLSLGHLWEENQQTDDTLSSFNSQGTIWSRLITSDKKVSWLAWVAFDSSAELVICLSSFYVGPRNTSFLKKWNIHRVDTKFRIPVKQSVRHLQRPSWLHLTMTRP